jgi:predicted RNA-binding Zn-ribbon protein involved in translation (DUF1610 family)
VCALLAVEAMTDRECAVEPCGASVIGGLHIRFLCAGCGEVHERMLCSKDKACVRLLSVQWIVVHEVGPACGMPGSTWHDDGCREDSDRLAYGRRSLWGELTHEQEPEREPVPA